MKKLEKVILLQNNKLGKKYQTKEVRRGFVVNYLLPRKEVLLVNEKSLSWLEKQQDKQVQADLILEEEAQKAYNKINNFTLAFTLKKNEKGEPFGSVDFKEILTELEKADFACQRSQLLEFHPLNKLGENIVKVKLSNRLTANLKVTIK